jgi:hypothetical protein
VTEILGAIVGLLAFASWLYATSHWVRALKHRRPDVSLSTLLLHGMKSFDPGNFEPTGHPHVRAMTRGFMAFFLCLFAGFGVVALAIATQ